MGYQWQHAGEPEFKILGRMKETFTKLFEKTPQQLGIEVFIRLGEEGRKGGRVRRGREARERGEGERRGRREEFFITCLSVSHMEK